MLKRLLNSPFMQALIGRILGLYMLLVGYTTRWTYIDRDIVEAIWAKGGPVVICFWHGRIVLSYWGWTVHKGAQKAKVLISHSREGGIVADATKTVGAGVIRGSSAKAGKQKGGMQAMREMLRTMEAGQGVALAPDGPRGPRMRAQMGVIQLAKHAQAPIVCLGWATNNAKVFNSWDRFALPRPFGRGAYAWGGPIHVPRDANAEQMETLRLHLETLLNEITAKAEDTVGMAHIGADAA